MTQFALLILAIFFVAMLIPQFLVRSIIGPVFRIFVIPGVIIHELAHALFCLLTGAKIQRIRVFRPGGGDVAHEPSKIPFVGPLLITIAPLIIGVILIILISTRIAPHVTEIAVGSSLHDFPQFLFAVFAQVQWGHVATWFWLYLILSIGATAAPSWQDLRNSTVPIVFIAAAFAAIMKFGLFHTQLDQAVSVVTPALVIVLFVLLVIALLAGLIYAASSVFGIHR